MSELIEIIPLSIRIFIILVLLFLVDSALSLIKDNDSFYAARLFTVKQRWNKLYMCKKCGLMYRYYQKMLYKENRGKSKCPHCETFEFNSERIAETKWTKHVKSAPMISYFGCLKMKIMVLKLRKIKKEMEDQKFFEEYNNIKVDYNWIENLQKRGKDN